MGWYQRRHGRRPPLRHLLVFVVVLSVVVAAVVAGVAALLDQDVWYEALFVGGTLLASQLTALLTVRLLRRDERIRRMR